VEVIQHQSVVLVLDVLVLLLIIQLDLMLLPVELIMELVQHGQHADILLLVVRIINIGHNELDLSHSPIIHP